MRSKSMSNKNLMMKIITSPYRVLCKAKDFYVRSITDCSNGAAYGMTSMSTPNPLSRNSSTSSYYSNASEDLRELIRANSTASMRDVNISRADLDVYIKQHMMNNKQSSSLPVMGSKRVPRSVSVGMARIDEDAPVSSFRDDEVMGNKVKSDHVLFPRSKSHAVSSSAKINRYS